MFLHGGVIHYGINMVALHAVGTALEQAHGAGVTAILFVISGVGATIISAVFAPQYISVGASGAIFGLVGACIGDIILHWSLLFGATLNGPVGICRLLFILFTFFFEIAINFVIGLTPAIDNWTREFHFQINSCSRFCVFDLPCLFLLDRHGRPFLWVFTVVCSYE